MLDVLNGQWGFYGVAIFFAISGFLMSDLLQKTDCWTFILHRAVRIYPLYYLVLLAFFPWQAGYDAVGLLLVPAGPHPGPLGIEWTLVYETAFYVVLFVVSLVGLARHVAAAASVWLAAILLTTWFAPELQNTVALPIQTFLLSSMNVGFAAGLLLPTLMKRAVLWPFFLMIGVPLIVLSLRVDLHTMRWMGGLAVALAVGTAAQLPQIKGENIISRTFIKLGDWSYATYLVHPCILWTIYQAKEYRHPLRIWALSLVATAAVTLVIGPLDIRLYRYLRGKVNRLTRPKTIYIALGYLGVFTIGCVAGAV